MASATLEKVYEDVKEIKLQLKKLAMLVGEDFELSESAKKELEEARRTSRAEYVSQEEIEKEFLR